MTKILYLFLTLLISSAAFADKNMKIGKKGKISDVTRTIQVKMYDNYYEPNSFSFKKGETVKFEVINAGELVHEFNIANAMLHLKHQPEMSKMVEHEILLPDSIDKEKMKNMGKTDHAMGHAHSNSVLLSPNEKGTIIWKFVNAVNIEIACNVPGHYQDGMIAAVNLN
ncbi:MAG: cupredoxin domain-containing protein [Pelagibacteraceae bacterium]|tara:strand:+ start:144 stop:647 length:504 start_codon:yes stop_codon:yes gene_type:complete